MLCLLCNLGVVEDVIHFLGEYPIVGHIRMEYIGVALLTNDVQMC